MPSLNTNVLLSGHYGVSLQFRNVCFLTTLSVLLLFVRKNQRSWGMRALSAGLVRVAKNTDGLNKSSWVHLDMRQYRM
jgi:hypothetical protein